MQYDYSRPIIDGWPYRPQLWATTIARCVLICARAPRSIHSFNLLPFLDYNRTGSELERSADLPQNPLAAIMELELVKIYCIDSLSNAKRYTNTRAYFHMNVINAKVAAFKKDKQKNSL
ncbi:jg21117 [Pararge aegeria aegeria]|uniref:Jg21117 protein n=1 Tax=Pararge aegeria aegeria TaxID=348720 RepID=A0A8S4RMI1_9NEOP|nr:jg21117 [Pararge aegeria aegeria]